MTDIFRRVKNLFSNLRSLIFVGGERTQSPYDKLTERFSTNKPIEVNELDNIKELCKQITSEEGQAIIDQRFAVLKDLMFERIVEISCKTHVTVNDKIIKDRSDYKDFIKREYKRMIHDEPEDRKESKRSKKIIKRYKNDVSWGILPEGWKLARESAPADVVEFALENDDEYNGPFLYLGEVPAEGENEYFTEEYMKDVYEQAKPSNIICDLYNPETNCRKCIRYEFNQEKWRNIEREIERKRRIDEEIEEEITKRFKYEKRAFYDLMKKAKNSEDKVWMNFIFNPHFRFTSLNDDEKNIFFQKLKKSGILFMDAIEKGEKNDVNTKAKEFAIRRELFDIKEENDNQLPEGNILNENMKSSFLQSDNFIPENDAQHGLFESNDEPNSFSISSQSKKEHVHEKPVLNLPKFEPKETDTGLSLLPKDEMFKNVDRSADNVQESSDKTKRVKSDSSEDEQPPKQFPFNLHPPFFGTKKDEEKKSETNSVEPKIVKEAQPKDGNLLNLSQPKDGNVNVPTETKGTNLLNLSHPKGTNLLNLTQPKDGNLNSNPLDSKNNDSVNPTEKRVSHILGERPKIPDFSAENPVKFPDSWHYFPKYPYQSNIDPSINPPSSFKTHPPVFGKVHSKTKTEISNISGPEENKLDTPLPSFLPLNNDESNLTTPTGSFSFTPSTTPFQAPATSTFPPISISSTSTGPSKRKMEKFGETPVNTSNLGSFNPVPITSPFNTGQSTLQVPTKSSNPELQKILDYQNNKLPFLGEVPNPFETSNPVQHSLDPNLHFVDNTFKYSDLFNKNNPNLFLNSKSMFDDIIFDNENNEDQESNVRYRDQSKDNDISNLFGSNIFGNDKDPWNK